MLSLTGACMLSVGVLIYSTCLKGFETRTLLAITLCIQAFGSFNNIGLTLEWYTNLGLSPYAYSFLTSCTIFPLTMAFYIIAPSVLIAKISPTHVEATVFSFSISVINSCIFVVARSMGILINSLFFDITTENLTELYKLYIWEVCGALICLFYIKLIPTSEEVAEVQKHLESLNLDAKTPL